jgi:hypothetical protein
MIVRIPQAINAFFLISLFSSQRKKEREDELFVPSLTRVSKEQRPRPKQQEKKAEKILNKKKVEPAVNNT